MRRARARCHVAMAPVFRGGKPKRIVRRTWYGDVRAAVRQLLSARSAVLSAGYWAAGIAAAYVTALICVAADGYGAGGGGVVQGIMLCLIAAVVTGVGSLFLELDLCTYLAIGLGTSLLPAALTASNLVLYAQYDAVKRIETALSPEALLMLRLDPEEEEARMAEAAQKRKKYRPPDVMAHFSLEEPIPRLLEADLVSGEDWTLRVDLMGGADVELPRASDLDRPNGYKLAGKDESGTFCAVPLVHANWTHEEPVHLWAVCDNEWQGEVNCTAAMLGEFDPRDWWGYRPVYNCFELAAQNVGEGVVSHGRRPALLQFDSGRDGFFRKAVVAAAEEHALLPPSANATMVILKGPCCDSETAITGSITAAAVVLALLPLGGFILNIAFGKATRRLRRKVAGLSFTRDRLRAIIADAIEASSP